MTAHYIRLLARLPVAFAALIFTPLALSFEFATHAMLTREAYLRTALYTDSGTLIGRLGLANQILDLGPLYVDMSGKGDVTRHAKPSNRPTFAADKIDLANTVSLSGLRPALNSLPGWLMQGSIREDDVTFDAHASENTPQDDPVKDFDRVFNHFYDPVKDEPLLILGIGKKAPDWALDGTGVLYDNRFSLRYAKEAMWRAITLRKIDAAGNLWPLAIPAGFAAYSTAAMQQEALRKAYWATTFRSLGDVVHLLQDMAQPQHTRADLHSGMGCLMGHCDGGHASYFENYVEARAAGRNKFTLRERLWSDVLSADNSENVAPIPLDVAGYALPRFSSYRDYFSTASGFPSESGKGLANYSNQGFYSVNTNIHSSAAYRSPPQIGTHPSLREVKLGTGQIENAAGKPITGGELTLIMGSVADSNDPSASATNIALSTYSVFDQFLALKAVIPRYTLNHYNYADQARLLLPRAVAYSAGLIDRFFRASLDIAAPDDGVISIANQTGCSPCSFNRVKVKVGNTSADESLSGGFFVAVATFHANTAYRSDLRGQPGAPGFPGFPARTPGEAISVSSAVNSAALAGGKLGPGERQLLTFDFPSGIGVDVTDLSLQVVYRGQLGTEADAVVAGSRNISEPSFMGFANISDYVWDDVAKRYNPLPVGRFTTTDDTLNIKLRFGAPTAPALASIPRLSAGQHAQVAVLADRVAQTMYVESASQHWLNASPMPVDYTPAEFFTPVNSALYDASQPVRLRRGVYRQNYFFWGLPADNTIYFCGVSDEHCIQATLPPLSPANVVPWTITF